MNHRLPRLLFVAFCALAPAFLGNLLHWSAWLWGFMCMVTTSGSLLLMMTARGAGPGPADAHEPREPEPTAVPQERVYEETRVIDAALPSAMEGYDFLFSATVWWKPLSGHDGGSDGAGPNLASSAIVARASEVVRREDPGRASFARYLLEGELGVAREDRSGRVQALAADVTLTLAPADRERLRRMQDLRKDEEVWEHERDHERSKRRYLGDDVLKSAGSAVVWWLSRHENEVEKAVEMIGPLAQIAAAANDEEVSHLFRHLLVPSVAMRDEETLDGSLWGGQSQEGGTQAREEDVSVWERLLSDLDLKPDTDERMVFVHRLVRTLDMSGLHDAAEEVRRTLLTTPDEDGEAGETGDESSMPTASAGEGPADGAEQS
ncbi:hypothetical protein ACN20G_03130 [Streptomyces sp. BI20]|uniref:hypothetical protein n=1 Tax=Streptomyces sp. BI20 TaxID=3403460 RepID=UPI003C7276F6